MPNSRQSKCFIKSLRDIEVLQLILDNIEYLSDTEIHVVCFCRPCIMTIIAV